MPDRAALVVADLSTERLALRPLDPDADAADLHEKERDPRVHQFIYGAAVSTGVDETRARLRAELAANGGVTWSIRLRDEPTVLGTIGLFGDQGTTTRGLAWSLAPEWWGMGITGEAAATVVAFLLAQPGIDGLEAWIDSRNEPSLAVALRAGLSEVARLPRSYENRIGQTVVMAIAAQPADPAVFTVEPVLAVGDVAATAALLGELLGLEVAWTVGEPAAMAKLAVAPWSGSAGVRLRAAAAAPGGSGAVAACEIVLEVGVWVDDVCGRARGAGLEIVTEPEDRPWGRRDFAFLLPEGHRVEVSGATTPG
jgi:RimJ/RimL family protein N-acetyltransferase/catechol 2,3-dioxygenase-like lactoylglutathione lyase family enzyme